MQIRLNLGTINELHRYEFYILLATFLASKLIIGRELLVGLLEIKGENWR